MLTLGEFLVSLTGGARIELFSRTGLPRHMGNNTGRPIISDTFQRGSGQCHQNMAVHDGAG